MTRYISPLEQAYIAIEQFFTQEFQEGLLDDVNTFLTAANNQDHIDAPIIWLEKETIPETSMSCSDSTLIDIPFNLVCCAEITDDLKRAEEDSLNLACRCITSLYKNIIKTRSTMEHIQVRGFTIGDIDPNGTFEIINKSTLLPATRLKITFHLEINFMLYLTEEGEQHYYGDDDLTLEEINYDIIGQE